MFKLIESIMLTIGNLFAKGAGRVTNTLLKAIDSIVSKITEAFAWAFVGFFLYTLIVDVLLQGSPELQAKMSGLVGKVIGDPTAAASMAAAPVDQFFDTASVSVGDFIFNKIINIFTPGGPPTPETAATAAKAFFGHLTLVAVTSWIATSFADVLSLGKFESIGQLPEKIDRTLKLGRLAPALLADPISVMVSQPLAEGYLRKFPPNRFTITQILDMHAQGIIDIPEFKDRMLSMGFDEEGAFKLAVLRFKKFSTSQLKQLFDRQILDEKDLKTRLQLLEFVDEDADLLVQMLTNERAFELQENIAKEALKLFENGQIDESTTTSLLDQAHWQDEEMTLAIQLGKLKRLETDLTLGQLLSLMGDKLLTQAQVFKRLQDRGYDDSDAQMLINQELIKSRISTPVEEVALEKPLTQAQILKAFKEGLITAENASQRLVEEGVGAADIGILLKLNAPTP